MVTYVLSAEAFATGIQICDQEISFFIYRDSLDKNVISIVDPLILSLGVNSLRLLDSILILVATTLIGDTCLTTPWSVTEVQRLN